MNLVDKKHNFNEMSFDDIEKHVYGLLEPYYTAKSYNLINIINELIILEKYIIDKRGKNKNRIEDNILLNIRLFYKYLISNYEFDFVYLKESLINNTENTELKQVHSISLKILKLIQLIFDFNMPKDNYSSNRKSRAIGLLCSLLKEYYLNGVFDYFRIALESGKSKLIYETTEELKLLIEIPEIEIPDNLINLLYQ